MWIAISLMYSDCLSVRITTKGNSKLTHVHVALIQEGCFDSLSEAVVDVLKAE